MTKVVFRKFKDGEVIAVFPEVSWNYVHLMSYQHVGQHGDCVPWIASFTKPATLGRTEADWLQRSSYCEAYKFEHSASLFF